MKISNHNTTVEAYKMKCEREYNTNLSDEEIERIADEFSRIGCTSFRLTADELKEIIEKECGEN